MPATRANDCLLEFRAYRRTFRKPLATAHGTWTVREGIIVRLTDSTGCIGYGEAAPVPGFTQECTADDLAWLAKQNSRVSPVEFKRVPSRLGSLRWALSCAGAMQRNQFTLAQRKRTLPVAALLPTGRSAQTALARQITAGYRTFKWKVATLEISTELKILDQLLEALPRGARLRLDANGGLTPREFALWSAHLKSLGRQADRIEFFEQPLAPSRQQPHHASPGVPVALDESVSSFEALKGAQRWPGSLVVKPSLLGDLTGFLRWRARASRDLVYSSAFETSVGLHAALWLAATDPCAGKRALGFGTMEAFGNDGLQLPAHTAGPKLKFTPLTAHDFTDLWNRLPH